MSKTGFPIDENNLKLTLKLSKKPTKPVNINYWLGSSATDVVVSGTTQINQDTPFDTVTKKLVVTESFDISSARQVTDRSLNVYASKLSAGNANAVIGNAITLTGDPSLVPALPTAPEFTSTASHAGGVQLSWNAVAGATGYKIGRATSDNPLYIDTEFDTNYYTTNTSFLDLASDMPTSDYVYYWVKAVNSAHASPWCTARLHTSKVVLTTSLAFVLGNAELTVSISTYPSGFTPSQFVAALGYPAGTAYGNGMFKHVIGVGNPITVDLVQSPTVSGTGMLFTLPVGGSGTENHYQICPITGTVHYVPAYITIP